MVVTSKYSTSYSSCIRRRRINILHNARLISDRVQQRASSEAHYGSWGHDGACFLWQWIILNWCVVSLALLV